MKKIKLYTISEIKLFLRFYNTTQFNIAKFIYFIANSSKN